MSFNSSFNDLDASSDAIQLNAQHTALIRKNEQLTEENASLKKQLDSAIEFSDKNAELQRENAELHSKIRSLSSEKEDLAKRISLLLKNQEEKAKELKNQSSERISANAMFEQNNLLKKQLSEFQEKYENLKNETEQTYLPMKKLNDEMSKSVMITLTAGNSYFGKEFQNLKEFSDFLLSCPGREQAFQEKIQQQENENQEKQINEAKLLTQIAKLKKRNGTLKAALVEQENKMKRIESYSSSLLSQIDEQMADFQNKEKENEHKQQIKDLQKEQEIKRLMTEIETCNIVIRKLKQELDTKKCEDEDLSSNEADNSSEKFQEKLQRLQSQLNESQKLQSTYKNQVMSFSAQVKQLEIARNSAERKNESLNREKLAMLSELKSLREENSLLRSEVESSQEKINCAMAQIKSAKISFTQSKSVFEETETEQAKLTEAMKLLQSEIKDQKEELHKLYTERERVVSLIKKHGDVIAKYGRRIQELEEENKELKQNPVTEQKPVLLQETIPVTSWFCAEFPRELCELISQFAKNESLPSTGKLKNILPTIAKYYQATLHDLRTDLSNTKAELQNDQTNIESFLIKVGETLQTSFPCNDSSQLEKIAEIFDNICSEREQAIQDAAELQAKHQNLLSKIEVGTSEEAVEEVNKLFDCIEKQTATISSLRTEGKKLSKLHKIASDEVDFLTKENEQKTQEYEQKLIQQQALCQKQTEKLYEAEKQLIELKGQSEIAKAEHDKEAEALHTQMEELKRTQEAEIERVKSMFLSTLNAKDNGLEEKECEIDRLQREIEQCKHNLSLAQASVDGKDKEIVALRQENEDAQHNIKKSVEEKARLLQAHYENLVAEIKEKNADILKLNDKLTGNLQECEMRLKAMTNEKGILEHNVYELQNRFKAFEETSAREKRIQESKVKAKLMEQEISFQCAIEEEKDAHRARLQALFDFASSTFKEYFDPTQPLDENSFTTLCENVKKELDALRQSDEKIHVLLGIENNEKPEEALSKFILSFYSK